MLENNSLRNITNITALLYPVTQYTLSYKFICYGICGVGDVANSIVLVL